MARLDPGVRSQKDLAEVVCVVLYHALYRLAMNGLRMARSISAVSDDRRASALLPLPACDIRFPEQSWKVGVRARNRYLGRSL